MPVPTIPEVIAALAAALVTAPPTNLETAPPGAPKKAVAPPITALFNTSLRLPPPRAVTPPEAIAICAATPAVPLKPKAAGPTNAAKATVATTLPIGLETTFLTAVATVFTAPPIALPIFLNNLYSGNPVSGLITPMPPRLRSKAASCGLM